MPKRKPKDPHDPPPVRPLPPNRCDFNQQNGPTTEVGTAADTQRIALSKTLTAIIGDEYHTPGDTQNT